MNGISNPSFMEACPDVLAKAFAEGSEQCGKSSSLLSVGSSRAKDTFQERCDYLVHSNAVWNPNFFEACPDVLATAFAEGVNTCGK